MNVIIENENKNENKLKICYLVIIAICVISIFLTLILQNKEEVVITEEISHVSKLSKEEISRYKEEFNNIFENKVNYLENNSYKIKKIKENDEIVSVGYKINEIKETFVAKAKSILETQNKDIIYTVKYSAYISNNILSVVIRSTLKEGINAQRDIVQTYNYDLINQKKCTIDDILEIKKITKKDASQEIKNEINKIQERVEELANLGYSVYSRDYTSDSYSINNVTEYFLGNDNILYIIYAYGNQNHTSEMDIVIM